MIPLSSALLLAGAIAAFLVLRRHSGSRRRRGGRLAFFAIGHLVLLGLARLDLPIGEISWATHLATASDLLGALAWIGLAGVTLFDLLLPAIRVHVIEITYDLLVAAGYVVATVVVLGRAGLDTSSVIATSAVLGAIVTFSLQTTLQNAIGGLALRLDGSIQVGDWLQLEGGRTGRVRQIRWRHTVIETLDWDTVIVPNDHLLRAPFLILGKREGRPVQRRVVVRFGVGAEHEPSRVVRVVEEALAPARLEGLATEPPPSCVALDLLREGPGGYFVYALRYWLTDLAAEDAVSSRVRARIVSGLGRQGIRLARPAGSVLLEQAEDEPTRKARQRAERLALLRRLELFHPLTEPELASVADHLVEAPFAAGETVTRHGAVAHWLYLLSRGKVTVVARSDEGDARAIASLSAPAFFGEMGLLTGEPRFADVIAEDDVLCYRLDKSSFEHVLVERPEMAGALSALLAKRKVELEAVREDLDQAAGARRRAQAESEILARIRSFFGLG